LEESRRDVIPRVEEPFEWSSSELTAIESELRYGRTRFLILLLVDVIYFEIEYYLEIDNYSKIVFYPVVFHKVEIIYYSSYSPQS